MARTRRQRNTGTPPGGNAVTARAKFLGSLSAVALVVVGSVFTPLGTKLVNLVWPDPPTGSPPGQAASPTARIPSAAEAASVGGCQPGGPALSVTMTYAFTGSSWWATEAKLPATVLDRLNAKKEEEVDPSAILAEYQPVEMEFGAGTLLKLAVTGCGPKPVVITNMYAAVSKRQAPLAGSVVFRPPQGSLGVTPVAFDLDAVNRPTALTYEPHSGKTGDEYFAGELKQVAPDETVPFEIMGLTKRSYVEWSLVIDALVDGHPWETTLGLANGQPIRSTAAAETYQSAYLLSISTYHYEQTDPTQLATRLRR